MGTIRRLKDPEGREQMKARVNALRAALVAHAPGARALFDALDRDLAEFVGDDAQALLEKMLAWDEEDFAFAGRVRLVYARMVEAAQVLLEMTQGAARLDCIAAALDYWTEASKWELISLTKDPPQRLPPLHALYEEALAVAGTGHGRRMMANGSWTKVTIEALYVRALVLRRLSGGHLGARQIEILDCWLLAWTGAARLTADESTPWPRLCLQADSENGLVVHPDPALDPPVYLPLAAYAAHLDEALEALQRGDLYPGSGPATAFRIEDHLGLLDVLRREFAPHDGAAPARVARNAAEQGAEVDIFVGLGEVFRGGFAPAAVAGAEAFAPGGSAPLLKRARRYRLRDHNEIGVGLLATREESAHLEPGDVLGVRLDPSAACVVVEVVRKVLHSSDDGDTLVGARVLAREAMPVNLFREGRAGAPGTEVEALYVPGEDSSGRADSLLVSESVFQSGGLLMSEGPTSFRFRLSRGRKRGRGWVLAGLEFVAEGPVAPPAPPRGPTAAEMRLID